MGSEQNGTNRRNDSLSGSTGSNGTTPTKYDVYQSNSSTLSRDRSGHEGEHYAMQRSSKIFINSITFIMVYLWMFIITENMRDRSFNFFFEN